MTTFLVVALIILLLIAISWAATVGGIFLICLCFGLTFSLVKATGIWLVLTIIGTFLRGGGSKND